MLSHIVEKSKFASSTVYLILHTSSKIRKNKECVYEVTKKEDILSYVNKIKKLQRYEEMVKS